MRPWHSPSPCCACRLREFWALTPRELALAMRPFLKANAAPDRSEFDRLFSAFPDQEI